LQRGRDWDEQPPRFARNQGEACGFVETDASVKPCMSPAVPGEE